MINVQFHTGIVCDIGDAKPTNQDSYLVKTGIMNDVPVGLFVVADGMGGLAHGEEASNLIVTYLDRWWTEVFIKSTICEGKSGGEINVMLDFALEEINALALSYSKYIEEKTGSTISLLLIVGRKYYVKNVGDSRIYRIRGTQMIQITEDQSLVAELIRDKRLTEAEAKNHKRKNVLTMCIGVYEKLQIFSAGGEISHNDTFMLCSDGFYNYADEENIIPTIHKSPAYGLENTAQVLRSFIPQGGARDNVTIVLIKPEITRLFHPIPWVLALVLVCVLLWFLFGEGAAVFWKLPDGV